MVCARVRANSPTIGLGKSSRQSSQSLSEIDTPLVGESIVHYRQIVIKSGVVMTTNEPAS